MGAEVHIYKIAGILVRISKSLKPAVSLRENRILGGTLGNAVFIINVEGKRDTAFTFERAKKRAGKLAVALYDERVRIDNALRKSKDLFSKTGCPF